MLASSYTDLVWCVFIGVSLGYMTLAETTEREKHLNLVMKILIVVTSMQN